MPDPATVIPNLRTTNKVTGPASTPGGCVMDNSGHHVVTEALKEPPHAVCCRGCTSRAAARGPLLRGVDGPLRAAATSHVEGDAAGRRFLVHRWRQCGFNYWRQRACYCAAQPPGRRPGPHGIGAHHHTASLAVTCSAFCSAAALGERATHHRGGPCTARGTPAVVGVHYRGPGQPCSDQSRAVSPVPTGLAEVGRAVPGGVHTRPGWMPIPLCARHGHHEPGTFRAPIRRGRGWT
jgi:hypothetical protein